MKQQEISIITTISLNEAIADIGNICRKVRRSKRMSVKDLSEITAIHTQTITNFENKKSDLTSSRLLKILEVLQIEILKELPSCES